MGHNNSTLHQRGSIYTQTKRRDYETLRALEYHLWVVWRKIKTHIVNWWDLELNVKWKWTMFMDCNIFYRPSKTTIPISMQLLISPHGVSLLKAQVFPHRVTHDVHFLLKKVCKTKKYNSFENNFMISFLVFYSGFLCFHCNPLHMNLSTLVNCK